MLGLVLAAWAAVGLPSISFVPGSDGSTGAVEVSGLDARLVAEAAAFPPDAWTRLFAVYVAAAGPADPETPAIVGSYTVAAGRIRFVPRYPLAPGLRYRAVLRLPDRPGEPIEKEFLLPRSPAVATTVVEAVYPTGERVPENLLKLYLHFSAPMSRGEAYRRVHLLDGSGKPVDLPFLEIEAELWDREGRRLTLLFDPGRIKRGLRPREESGPILEEGKSYVLVVDRDWPDAAGNPLKSGYRKQFRAGAPDAIQPDPKRWKLRAPRAGSRAPLLVGFAEPLDHAMLERVLRVLDPSGRRVAGRVDVEAGETAWRFTPDQRWRPGGYQLEVETTLEDLAGNSIGRQFEVDAVGPIERRAETPALRIRFEVR